jgi:hypothetical protein
VGCGSARGALGCGRGAAEAANGGEQDYGRALVTVGERRRKRGGEKKSRRAPRHTARPRGVAGERGAAAGSRRRDMAASGGGGATWLGGENASGVGRAASGRSGGHVVRVGRRGGSWWLGRSPARGRRAAQQ